MDRKAICAFLINCEPDQFMAYADKAELGSVVVGPDGKKYRFSVADLEAGDLKLNPPKPKPPAKSTRGQAKPKPKAPAKRKTRQSVKSPDRSDAARKAKKT